MFLQRQLQRVGDLSKWHHGRVRQVSNRVTLAGIVPVLAAELAPDEHDLIVFSLERQWSTKGNLF